MGVLLFEDCLAEAVWPGMALERGGEGRGGGGVASFFKNNSLQLYILDCI